MNISGLGIDATYLQVRSRNRNTDETNSGIRQFEILKRISEDSMNREIKEAKLQEKLREAYLEGFKDACKQISEMIPLVQMSEESKPIEDSK